MRRIIVALFAMVAGTTLLVGLKSQGLGAAFPLSAEGPVDPAAGGDPSGAIDGSVPTGAAEPTEAAGPTATATTPEPTGDGGAEPTTMAPTTDAAPAPSGTYVGSAVAVVTAQSPNNRSRPCGDCHDYSMAVTIVVSNGRITNASVAYNPGPGQSQRYADKATNTLSQKLLSAQTWRLGNVSGATYSANAFELSVQDAMSQAGLPT